MNDNLTKTDYNKELLEKSVKKAAKLIFKYKRKGVSDETLNIILNEYIIEKIKWMCYPLNRIGFPKSMFDFNFNERYLFNKISIYINKEWEKYLKETGIDDPRTEDKGFILLDENQCVVCGKIMNKKTGENTINIDYIENHVSIERVKRCACNDCLKKRNSIKEEVEKYKITD